MRGLVTAQDGDLDDAIGHYQSGLGAIHSDLLGKSSTQEVLM